MRFVFWLSLVGILYTYIGYPVLIWLLSRLFPRRWTFRPITPSVSIVLAVHNGASLLPGKIAHLLNLDYPDIPEIILVSDGSTDETNQVAGATETILASDPSFSKSIPVKRSPSMLVSNWQHPT